jgi:hypothetical protein
VVTSGGNNALFLSAKNHRKLSYHVTFLCNSSSDSLNWEYFILRRKNIQNLPFKLLSIGKFIHFVSVKLNQIFLRFLLF